MSKLSALTQVGKIRSAEPRDSSHQKTAPKRFTVRKIASRFLRPVSLKTGNDDKSSHSSDLSSEEKIAEVRRFLDSAILAAAKERLSVSQPASVTPAKWIWQLASSYYLTHATPPLMQAAAQRFAAAKRWQLAQWAEHKSYEEKGHDQLALLDIEAMGYDAQAVVERFAPSGAIALVNFFARSAQAADPIDCVGYSYTLERLALLIDASHIQQVEAALPSGVQATRCLRMHSSLGGDVHHVEETLEVIADLTSEEQRSIRHACYETACLYFNSLQAEPVSEVDLQQALSHLRIETCN